MDEVEAHDEWTAAVADGEEDAVEDEEGSSLFAVAFFFFMLAAFALVLFFHIAFFSFLAMELVISCYLQCDREEKFPFMWEFVFWDDIVVEYCT